MAESSPKVTGLNVFPVKSCHVLQVEEILLDSRGVVDDRRFMLVDGNGRFVTQRKFPKLATVSCKFITDDRGQRLLQASAPGMDNDLVFLPNSSGERTEVGIWEDKVMVVDQGEEPAEWFSKFIGHGGAFIRLVASTESSATTPSPGAPQTQNFHRVVSNLPLGLRGRLPNMELALADAGPVSMVSMESLADVNSRLKQRECTEVPLNRFRMNIEISGCSRAFEEDSWLLVKIGSVPFLAYTNAEVRGVVMHFCLKGIAMQDYT